MIQIKLAELDPVSISRHVPRLVPKPAQITNSLSDGYTLREELQDMIGEDLNENLASTSAMRKDGKILSSC